MQYKMVDISHGFDESAKVDGGRLYRKGTIVQVKWKKQGKETWVSPDLQNAKDNFKSMKERWKPKKKKKRSNDDNMILNQIAMGIGHG